MINMIKNDFKNDQNDQNYQNDQHDHNLTTKNLLDKVHQYCTEFPGNPHFQKSNLDTLQWLGYDSSQTFRRGWQNLG